MDALEALHTRSSAARLDDVLPGEEVLHNIYKAAFRAADHALLRPWRFLLIKGAARERLGELFVSAALAKDPELLDVKQQKLRRKPLRAPLLIVVISSPTQHPKVPLIEQDLSAAAATQNMLLAAHAQGVGAMWRTGAMAYDAVVNKGLGLSEDEKVIGFLYVGTSAGASKTVTLPAIEDYFKEW